MRLFDESLKIYYEKNEDHITILEGDHQIENADIPEMIDGLVVTAIAKKAFLGCKLLKSIIVPNTISVIGDFAFAMCDHLVTVSIPQKEIKLGQSLFKNDINLQQIVVRAISNENHASHLLTAATNQLNADYLIDPVHAGENEWFRMWDQKLTDFLNRKDDEGYHLYVLCGEEDLHFDYDQYVEYIREKKSGLCMLRLLNDSVLSDFNKNLYVDYLVNHVEIENEFPVFNYLIKYHGDDEEYFRILIENGIITIDNRELLLNLLGDRHLQTKTYLINAFKQNVDDFFGDLML